MRRHSFILVEVLISITLFAVLLTTLFSIFSNASRINLLLTKQISHHEEKIVAQSTLQKIFSQARFTTMHTPYFYIKEEGSQHSSSGQSLIFTYHNDTLLDPEFSSDVLGKLSLENECLVLTTWPHPKSGIKEVPSKSHKQSLLSNIKILNIKAFKADDLNDIDDSNNSIKPPTTTWTSYWPIEYDAQPTLLQISTDQDHFWFIFTNEIKPVIYKKT